MKLLLQSIIWTIALGATTIVQAQNFGYVNTQELIQSIPEVKEANSNIETFRNQLQKKGQDMIKSLQSKYADLEKRRDELSPKQLEQEAEKLKTEEQQIMTFDKDSQQQILKKSENLLQPLREKIQAAIDDVAVENGYTYIFDYSTGFLLYGDQSADVSALVRAKLGL